MLAGKVLGTWSIFFSIKLLSNATHLAQLFSLADEGVLVLKYDQGYIFG